MEPKGSGRMNNTEWMKIRHSVRQYDGKPLAKPIEEELRTLIAQINKKSGQDFQLLVDEPKAFSGTMAHYGKFSGVVNYIALVGNSEEKLGYYGEEIVKRCTLLGLKTCWVGMTYKKEKSLMHVKPARRSMASSLLAPLCKTATPIRCIPSASLHRVWKTRPRGF